MPVTDTRPATEKQLAYLRTLSRDRDWHDRLNGAEWELAWDVLGKERFVALSEASATIAALLKCPRKHEVLVPDAVDPLAALPLSRFIVDGEHGQPVHVEVVARRGRRYLNVLVGAPGDWHRQWVSYATQLALAHKVQSATYADGDRTLTGPEAAAVRFSREYTICAVCASPLSDETSVRLGIGPVCRKRFNA